MNKLLKKIKSLPGRSIAIQIYSHESETIYSKFKVVKKYLNTTKKDSQQISQDHLQALSEERHALAIKNSPDIYEY